MGAPWCKVSCSLDSHPKIRQAGNLGRQVFEFCLRVNAELDREGVIPAAYLSPVHLSNVLMLTDLCTDMSRSESDVSGQRHAAMGLSRCVQADLLVSDGRDFRIVGWDDEWAKHPLTEAQRKAAQRARQRNYVVASDMSRSESDMSRSESDCPDSHRSEERRVEKIRGEERRSGPGGTPARAIPAPLAVVPALVAPTTEAERLERDRWCTAKWDEINAHRARIAKQYGLRGVQVLHPHDEGRVAMACMVRDGGDEAKARIEHVIAVRVAEAEHKHTVKWLGGRMFIGDQLTYACQMTVDDAAGIDRIGPKSAVEKRDVTVGRIEGKGPEHYGLGDQKI